MKAIVDSLSRHTAALLASAVFLGLLVPGLASLLRPSITPIIAGLLFVAMLRIPLQSVDASRRTIVVWVLAWLLIISPLLAWLVTRLVPLPGDLRVPVILMCAAPSLLAAPAMALLLRMDAALMLGIVTAGSLVCPLTIALIPGFALELSLGVEPAALFMRFAALIGGAFIAASIVRRCAGEQRLQRVSREIDVLGLVLLIVFAVAIMDGVTDVLMNDPVRVLRIVALAFAVNLTLQAIGMVAFSGFGARSAVTVAFASGNRNMGIWLAVLPLSAGSDTMLYIAAAQFPIYILPLLLAPLYATILR